MSATDTSFISLLLKNKWLIVVITAFFAVTSAVIALGMPDKYEAEILLSPSENTEAGGGLAGLASQFGGIASLAGLNLSSGGSNEVGVALSLLKSRAFLQHFIEKRQILPELLALDSWDKVNQQLVYKQDIYDPKSKQWVRIPPKGKDVVPTPWEGFVAFTNVLTVGDIKGDNILRIALELDSPDLAVTWLNWLIEDLNQTLREKELAEITKSIAFLELQIEKTNVQELKAIFYRLVEEQTKKLLLAEVREEFVFEVVAAPVFPEDRSSPNRALICIAMTLLGGIFSVFLVLVKHLFLGARKQLKAEAS